jgi:hypothetical protein
MEEGPEPHEGIERMVEEHHHHEHGGPNLPQPTHGKAPEAKHGGMMLPAVTAAVLAVCAALGSLLSGHAANEAILGQERASDQWAEFQARSTKGHVYKANRELLESLATLQGARPEQVQKKLDDLQAQVDKYNAEKAETMKDAQREEAESRHEFIRHQHFALGVAAFQIGIVLASISILARSRVLYGLGIVAGVIGVVFVLIGLSGLGPAGAEAPEKSPEQRSPASAPARG